jgi:hypothetical protein
LGPLTELPEADADGTDIDDAGDSGGVAFRLLLD